VVALFKDQIYSWQSFVQLLSFSSTNKEKTVTLFSPRLRKSGPIYLPTALIVLLLYSPLALAQSTATSAWDISADKITRLENPQRIIAEGNIVLIKRQQTLPPVVDSRAAERSQWSELLEEKGTPPPATPAEVPEDQEPQYTTQATIKADWITYNVDSQSILARGNVSIESGKDRLMAETAQIDLKNETGALDEAIITIEDIELYLEGKRIEKTGLNTYRIEDGWVITCKLDNGETPPWSFSSAETSVELGGYATLKHARFNIREVPVFYFPYLIVPVKNTRQTGLLIPEISNSSRDGFGLNLPFFINLSDSADLTLFPEYYDKRGFMPGAEFRYVVSEDSKGRFMGSYLDDQLSDPSDTAYYTDTGFTHTNSDRYWIRGKVDQDLGDSLIARVDVDAVSDRDYLEEFNSGVTSFNESQKSFLKTFGRGFEYRSDDQRQNRMQILKTWTGSSLNINFLAINDLREDKTSPTPLWKLPSMDYSGALPILESPLAFEWDAEYVNFWREEGVGGHRVDLFPRLSSPIPLGPYLETRAEIGGRGTFYAVETYGDGEWNQDETPSRFLPVFETEVATTFQRDFSLASRDYSRLSHSIRPFIGYDYIPEEDQEDLPEFDEVDRIEETNAFTYGVDSFFNIYDTDGGYDRQYGYIRLEQSYDIRSEASSEPFSPVTLKLGWKPLQKMSLAYKAEIPIDEDDNTTHGFAGSYLNSRGDTFGLDYRYNEDENIEQLNGRVKVRLHPKVIAALDVDHSISEGETNEATLSLTYLAQCWSVQLETRYTPTEEKIMLIFNLANIGAPIQLSF
jgi:LPS-assembly protein